MKKFPFLFSLGFLFVSMLLCPRGLPPSSQRIATATSVQPSPTLPGIALERLQGLFRLGWPYSSEEVEGLVGLPRGDVVLSGSTDVMHEEGEAWVVRLGPKGEVRWSWLFGGKGDETLVDLVHLSNGDLLAVGWTDSWGQGKDDGWIVRLSPEGHPRWHRVYGGSQSDQFWGVLELPGGDLLVVGGTSSFGAGGADVWVLRLDEKGFPRWAFAYGGPDDEAGASSYGELTARAAHLPNGTIVVATTTRSYGAGETDLWLLFLDEQGQVLGAYTYGGVDEENLWTVVATASGDVFVPGVSSSFSLQGEGHIWALKITASGQVLWQRQYLLGSGLWSEALSAVEDASGRLWVGGYQEEREDWDLLLMELNSSGILQATYRMELSWDWPNQFTTIPSEGETAMAGILWPADAEQGEDVFLARWSGGIVRWSQCSPPFERMTEVEMRNTEVAPQAAPPQVTSLVLEDHGGPLRVSAPPPLPITAVCTLTP